MRLYYLSVLLTGLLFSQASGEPWLLQNSAQNALAFAYQYGYPLYSYGMLVETYGEKLNTLYHERELASPGAINVVRPNLDTVYSAIFIDLSNSDLNFTVPEFDGRYWAESFFDIYGNTIANIGNIARDKPGTYLVRYAKDNPGIQYDNVQGGYKAYINLPTPYAWGLTRILVRSTKGDIETVRRFQDKMQVTERLRFDTTTIPPFNLSIFRDPHYRPGPNVSLELAIMRLTAAFSRENQPLVIQDRTWVADVLERAGIVNGSFSQPRGTNLTAASAAANESVTALLTTPGYAQNLGHNWTLTQPIGYYGSYYQQRYYIASIAWGAATNDQTLYPYLPDILHLGANQSYIIRFSRKPRVSADGFWSLTAYGGDDYLIPNSMNRYALGDRSNLTYPDGKRLSEGPDGPFDILLQPSDIKPPSNWTNNWIPVHAGGGKLKINLRCYGANAEMTDGSYVYPKIQLSDVIRV